MNNFHKEFWLAGAKGGTVGGQRYPSDDPEGIIGQTGLNGEVINTGAVSAVRTEILDLISEGEINGLVSGTWLYSGSVGNIGYSGAVFTEYQVPLNIINTPWLRSIYWNQVPIIDSAGKINFSNVNLSYTRGFPSGSFVGTNRQELTYTKVIGERLRAAYTDDQGNLISDGNEDYSKIYRILNQNCGGVYVNVRFGQLYKRNITKEEYGDVERTYVIYEIRYRPIFSDRREGQNYDWSTPQQVKVEGKISYGYIKSTRVDFITSDTSDGGFLNDKKFLGWEVKITRLTRDSIDTLMVNQTTLDSITEIYNNRFTNPNSAIVRSEFLSEYFNAVPSRAFDVELLKVQVPSNYDPRLKKYTGEWDGTFADNKQWTDNPAWCFYDLLTNRRYGLGKYIDSTKVDKWTLYKIGKYCDELVEDGFGGVEPRFSCNTIISTREEAIKVLNDLASVFRGIIYYGNGNFIASADHFVRLEEAIMEFTNASVKDGIFNYASSPKSSRRSVAVVRYNDKNNFYKPAIEYVEDSDAIKRYGIRELELTAYGTVSRGQAIRYGKWALETENKNFESLTFTAGPEAMQLRPGHIIKVYDRYRQGPRLGGRIGQFITDKIIELDTSLSGVIASGYLTGNLYNITINSPTYIYNPVSVNLTSSSQITGINNWQTQTRYFTGISATGVVSGKTRIELPSGLDFTTYHSGFHPIFIIDVLSGGMPQSPYSEYWRVLNVEESEPNEYNVLSIYYDRHKYSAIDTGAALINTGPINDIPDCPKELQPRSPNFLLPNGNYMTFWQFTPPNSIVSVKDYVVYVAESRAYGEGIGLADFLTATPMILPPDRTIFDLEVSAGVVYDLAVYSRNQNDKLCPNGAIYNDFTILKLGKLDGIRPIGPLLAWKSGNPEDPTPPTPAPIDNGVLTVNGDPVTIGWNLGNESDKDSFEDIFYRVTMRRPNGNPLVDKPNSEIYHQITGIKISEENNNALTARITIDVEYQIENITVGSQPRMPALPGSPKPPYRNYDMVIEVHDDQGFSSAGRKFIDDQSQSDNEYVYINESGLLDSDYSNAGGYLLVNISNPPITGVYLSTGVETRTQAFTSGSFRTSQYLGNDNYIYLDILDTKYAISDARGAILYYSGIDFSSGLAFSGKAGTTLIDFSKDFGLINGIPEKDSTAGDNALSIWGSYNSNIIPDDQTSGFMRMAFYDSFDEAYFTQFPDSIAQNLYSGLQISNSVKINRLAIGATSTTANGGSISLPANAAGFLLSSNRTGLSIKIPYYNA
jgi:hypothetical protein